MSVDDAPAEERALIEEHRNEIARTAVDDAVELYDLVSRVGFIAEDAAAELEFVDEDEGSLADVRLALDMLDEMDNALVYMNRQKRRVEGLLEELAHIEEDL